MATRVIWHPPLYAWGLLGLAALALLYKYQPTRLEGRWLAIAPLLIVAAVLVLRRLWEQPPAVTLCAAIALTVFSGGWSQMGLAGLPLNRLLVAVVLLQVLLRAPGIAQMPRMPLRNVHLLIGLTLIYALASAAASGTLTSKDGFLQLFDVFGVVPFLLFLVAPAVFSGRRERDLLLATLVGLGAYLGLTAIFESLGPQSFVFPSYIRHFEAETLSAVKASGPFQSPTAMGFACFACAVAALIALDQWRHRWGRCLALLVAAACAFGCFLTLERGVWIAAIAATVVTALATQTGRRLLAPGIAISAVALIGVFALVPSLSQSASERATYQQSLWDRQNQTAAGLRMVQAKPLFGFGLDSYEAESVDYFRQPEDYPMTGYTHGITIGVPDPILPIHNTYLSYAVELGLAGALLWLASIAWAIGGAILARGPASLRPWKLGLLAIAVFFLVVCVVDPHTAPFPMVLMLAWAGVAAGAKPLPSEAWPSHVLPWHGNGASLPS
ncbi:MAG: putative inorganic carbon ((-)) transporter [Solirubrobacterales bacterium]|jgi:O-antigen ligase|nr:putative inorganic carbon ((-)) transporter [Solirubrobacterales bacterium]